MEDHPKSCRSMPVWPAERRPVPPTPEISLLAAILEDACFCVRRGALVSRETRDDAIAWLLGEVRSAPFCSFREVCDVLGLDAQAVRSELLAHIRTRPARARAA